MIELSKLSSQYTARKLETSDIDEVVGICLQNTLFYRYTDARPTREKILEDMMTPPPGIDPSDKYYFGFFENQKLIAIMDLVDGYPDEHTAYIGFFMMALTHQGQKKGTAIIRETEVYLRSIGMTTVRLAIDKGNPQSTHFWMKNGFAVIMEVDVNGYTKLVAEKRMSADV